MFCVDLRTDVSTARTRRSGMPQFDVSVDVPVCMCVRACVLLNLVFSFIYVTDLCVTWYTDVQETLYEVSTCLVATLVASVSTKYCFIPSL